MSNPTTSRPDWIESNANDGCLTLNIGCSTLNDAEGKVLTEQLRTPTDDPSIQFVILDLEQVELITSPAIGALIVIHKRLATNRKMLLLTNLSNLLEEALGFLKLDKVFNICQGPDAIKKIMQGH
ncbi:MAG: hypothetical protein CMJ40_03210 [Phycisphaerae bacterium]|nr:hypothetical protein [Phycisphaerae bacterium]|tara:strand:- start:1959 stop:2333 length:375 start_codon:yes stop_codon:yes gene_type:complete